MTDKAQQYSMPDDDFQHLTTWCEGYFREDEYLTMRDAIVAMLEEMTPSDAAYSMAHGWSHCFNLTGI